MAKSKTRHWSGARLRELRVQAGLTQTELAGAAAIYQAEVSKYEREQNEPTFSTLVQLATALGVGLAAFDPAGERQSAAG